MLTYNNNWDITNQTLLNEQCFRYEYDARRQMIMKQVPGAQPTYMVYDARGRLILTQDGNMRHLGQWHYTQYDNLNRPVATGLWTTNQSLLVLQGQLWNSTSFPPPTYNYEELTHTYYDDYSQVPGGMAFRLPSAVTFQTGTSFPYPEAITQSSATRGLVTVTKAEVLDGSHTYLFTVNYYDDKARVVQTVSQNLTYDGNGNGIDRITNQYSFSGQILMNVVHHNKGGTNPQTHRVVSTYNYDNANRLLSITKSINSDINGTHVSPDDKIIVQNQYDELGRLSSKSLGQKPDGSGTPMETLAYDYNIRGWLLGVNRPFINDAADNYFGFELAYDNPASVLNANYANPQFNGNISGMTWKSKSDNQKRRYDYTYDKANRLLVAGFGQYNGSYFANDAVDFSCKMGYDNNGNLMGMFQSGLLANGTSGPVDQLSYTYQDLSNKLISVVDYANDPTTTLGDFRSSSRYVAAGKTTSSNSIDYAYDDNGNLTQDLNKDIDPGGITYNYLNLPSLITVQGATDIKGYISYTYDANGTKLQKAVKDVEGQVNTVTSYIGGFMYQDDVLQNISQEEGRIRFNPGDFQRKPTFGYDYFLKDHLGNVRMVLTDQKRTPLLYPAVTLETAVGTGVSPIEIEKKFYVMEESAITPATAAIALTATAGADTAQLTYTNDNGVINNNPNLTDSTPVKPADLSKSLYRMNPGITKKTGLNITLKVSAGDKMDITGKSYYNDATTIKNTDAPIQPQDIINSLVGGSSISTAGEIARISASSTVMLPIQAFLKDPNRLGPKGKPRAYINWILFDNNFKLVKSGFSQIGDPKKLKNHYEDEVLRNININVNGFLTVFVSNETIADVFFDNLQVIHTPSPILEETHYYPFGLTMSGISTKTSGNLENKKKYNGKELQSEEFSDGTGLELYDYGSRFQDPQTGRWPTIDPFAEKFYEESPYCYGGNNPVNLIDEGGNFKMKPSDQKKYSVLVGYLKNGIGEILGSKKIMDALMKYGHFTEKDIKDKLIKWDKGINIDIGEIYGDGSGYYPGGKGNHIQINKKLVEQLQNASKDDIQAALLAVISTILHESTHYGQWNANGDEQMFNYYDNNGLPTASDNELGKAFEIEVYHDGDYWENENSKKMGAGGIRDMKRIINRKKEKNEQKDLPHLVGQKTADWIDHAIEINPSINVTIIE